MWEEPFGALTPLAEHKGYALALMCEILGGVMTGGGSIAPQNERLGGIVNNMMSILIDPARFTQTDYLVKEMEQLTEFVTGSAPAGNLPVILPYDPERSTHAQRSQGIEFDQGNWDSLVEVAQTVGGIGMPERDPNLYTKEELKAVEEYINAPEHQVKRQPFKPWVMMGGLLAVVLYSVAAHYYGWLVEPYL